MTITSEILQSFKVELEKNALSLSSISKGVKTFAQKINESPLGKRVAGQSEKFYKTPVGKRYGEVKKYLKTSTLPIVGATGAVAVGGAALQPSYSGYHQSLANTPGASMPFSSWGGQSGF